MFVENFSNKYYYNDSIINRILELLVNPKSIIEQEHINMDYIRNNISKWIYKADNLIIKDIAFKSMDNIEEVVYISYSFKDKLNEERDDIAFNNNTVFISFIDYRKC